MIIKQTLIMIKQTIKVKMLKRKDKKRTKKTLSLIRKKNYNQKR